MPLLTSRSVHPEPRLLLQYRLLPQQKKNRARTMNFARRRHAQRRSPLTEAAHNSVYEALTLQCSASAPGVRLVQICYVDHSGPTYMDPHLHLQCLFDDRSRTLWMHCPGATFASLRHAASQMPGRVRLHRHEHNASEAGPPGGAASESVVRALPRLKLDARSAARLEEDGWDACPFCLDSFVPGETVVCIPCPGTHVAHSACTEKWLAVASTCPTCRFALPKDPSKADLDHLCQPAIEQLRRIALDEPPPCQEVEDEALAVTSAEASSDSSGSQDGSPSHRDPLDGRPASVPHLRLSLTSRHPVERVYAEEPRSAGRRRSRGRASLTSLVRCLSRIL